MHVCLTGFSGESEAAQLRQLVPRTSEVQALHRLVLFLRLLRGPSSFFLADLVVDWLCSSVRGLFLHTRTRSEL